MESLSDFAAKKGIKNNVASQEPTTAKKVWSFVKNIPSGIASGFGSPVALVEKTGATIGKKLQEKTGFTINVSPETIQKVKGVKAELEKPLQLPGQDIPIVKSAAPFTSGREVAAFTAEAAIDSLINFATMGTGSLIGGTVKAGAKELGKEVAKKTVTEVVKEAAPRVAKRSLFDFVSGTALGSAQEAQNADASAKDIISTGLKSGLINTVAPVALGTATKVFGKGVNIIGKATDTGLEKGIKKFDSMAKPKENTIETLFSTDLPSPPATKKQVVSEKSANLLRGIQKIPENIRKGIDKYAPLNTFAKRAQEEGIDSPDLREMAQRAPLAASGKSEIKLEEYLAKRKEYGDDWGYVKKQAQYLDLMDRLEKGPIVGGKTKQDVELAASELKAFLGDERFSKIQEGAQYINDFGVRELQDALDSGRINIDQFNKFRAEHPNYTPHEVLDYLDMDKPPQGTGKSFNVADSGFKKATGSERAIDDIDNAIISRLYRNSILNEKNKTVRAVIDVGRQNDNLGFKPLRTAEDVQTRNQIYKNIQENIDSLTKSITGARVLARIERGVKKEVADIASKPIESNLIKKTKENILKTTNEVKDLMEQAQVMASDFEAPSKIDEILTRVDMRDKKIIFANEKLSEEVMQYNTINAKDVKRKSESITRIRDTRKTLDKLIEEKTTDIADLRSLVKEFRDVKIKPVDYKKLGYEKISYFKDGIREDWLIPEDLGIALKHLDGQEASAAMRWLDNSLPGRILQLPAKTLKALATTWNPIFSGFSNPTRDVQTALQTSGVTPQDFAKQFGDSLINIITKGKGDDELRNLARSAGGLQGSIFREGLEPEEVLKRMVEKDKNNPFVNVVKHPLQAVESIGQKMEEFTRMTVFKSALKRGATVEEAAKIMRNATVDFSKNGNFLQIANKLIPFLNARVQGGMNLVDALRRDPTQFYRRAMMTAVYPTAMLYQNNSEYESYQKIPDNEKRKFWIIMVGEGEGLDISGRKTLTPHYIKIPKGEAQQVVSNVLERVMNRGKEKYPDSTVEFLGKLAGDFSPITDSNILPPGLQQFIELETNYSLFREKPIVPDYIKVGSGKGKWVKSSELPPEKQISESTSYIARKMGEALGWSPIKIDYVIKTGVLNDIIRAIDIPFKEPSETEGFQNISEKPFIKTVLGSSNYALDIEKKEFEREKLIEKNRQKLERQAR